MTPPGGCLPPPGGRLPLRGRWTGQSPGRMRGNNLTVLKIFDEWQSFILKRNRKVSLFDGVGFVRLACCPSSVRACGPATLSVGEGFLRRGAATWFCIPPHTHPLFTRGFLCSQQHRLDLPPLEGGFYCIRDRPELRHQGPGLLLPVVLPEGDEIIVLPPQQPSDVLRRAG